MAKPKILELNRTVWMMDDISSESVRNTILDLYRALEQDADDPLHLYIASGGGSVGAGWDLYNAIKALHRGGIDLYTIAGSAVNSAALLPFLAVPRERRAAIDQATVFVHEHTFNVHDTLSEVEAETILRKTYERRYAECVAKNTFFTVKQVESLMRKGTTLDYDKLAEKGFMNTELRLH